MGLNIDQIRERVKRPKKKNEISKAIKHENRIRFHVENYMDASEISQPLTDFLDWVKTLIPKDKYFIFLSLFRFPTQNIKLSNTIFNELERVFDGKNPSVNYQFTDSSCRDDWEWYRQEMLNEPEVWRKKGWDAVKTAINSVIIVDLPEEQTGDQPNPYFYFLGIENVIDFETKGDDLDWIIFKQKDNKIAAFDDTYYRILQLDAEGRIIGEPIEREHGIGYCPARFFWSTSLNQSHPDIKKSPISPQLSELDWLLFFSTSKKHLDLYAPYPIYSTYEADCDFLNNETMEYCDGGYLRDQNQNYIVYRDGALAPCPVCANKRIAGVGSLIEIPIPNSNEPDLGKNPVQITTIDQASLTWNVEEVKRLTSDIFTSVVGVGGDISNKSVNELQVEANFESKVSVLNSLKGNIEAAQKFVDETCCILRYGDHFLGSSISLGTEFYIYSVDDLYDQYKKAKENGSSGAILDSLMWQIIETEYRNDPTELQRMVILKHLEPYRHYTFNELITLSEKQLINPDSLKIKINFPTFVDRFERENTNIIEFGSQLEFDKKIKIITEKFEEYVRESNTENPGGDPSRTKGSSGEEKGGGQES